MTAASTVATPRISNRTMNNAGNSCNNKTGGTPWTKIPPAPGQSQTKTMHDKPFYWCATCKRWTASHKTSEHTMWNGATTGVATSESNT
jgi:hypothetical protein